jgi:hypothetical protein
MKLILDREGTDVTFTPVGNGDAQMLLQHNGLVAPIDLTQATQVTKAGVARTVIKASLLIPTTALAGDLETVGSYYALPKSVAFEAHIVVAAPQTVVQLCRNGVGSDTTLSLTETIISKLIRAVVTAATDNSLQAGGIDGGPDGLLANGGMPIVQSLTGKQAFDPVSGVYGEAAGN